MVDYKKNLQEIVTCKTDIKNAIIEKGVTPTSGLKSYADAVKLIPHRYIRNPLEAVDYYYGQAGYDHINFPLGIFKNMTPEYFEGENLKQVDFAKKLYDEWNASPKKTSAEDLYNHYSIHYSPLIDTTGISNFNFMYGRNPDDYPLFMFAAEYLRVIPPLNLSKATTTIHMFDGCKSLEYAPEKLNTTADLKNIAYMFFNCNKLKQLPLFSTSGVDIASFFLCNDNNNGDSVIEYIPKYDFSNLRIAEFMFAENHNLLYCPISELNSMEDANCFFQDCFNLRVTPRLNFGNKINIISELYSECHELRYIPKFNASTAIRAMGLFYNDYNLVALPELDLSKNQDFRFMCYNCKKIKHTPHYNTSEAIESGYMFDGCENLEEIPLFDMSKNTSMMYMFAGCKKITSVPKFNTHTVTRFNGMFSGCTNLKSVPDFDYYSAYDVSDMYANCINMSRIPDVSCSWLGLCDGMCRGCTKITSTPSVSTHLVQKFTNMFEGCTSLTNVRGFNTAKGTDFSSMFEGCTSLTSCPTFNMKYEGDYHNVTYKNIDSMFEGCTNLRNAPLFDFPTQYEYQDAHGEWTSYRPTLSAVAMYKNCKSLTSYPSHNIDSLYNVSSMFEGCTNLKSVGLLQMYSEIKSWDDPDDWDYYLKCGNMFKGCINLENLGGFKRLRSSLNLSDSPKLTHQSLLNVINELGWGKYGNIYPTLTLGQINFDKLTPDEIKIATDKHWTVKA